MSADKYLPHLPPEVRPEFVAWLAKRDAQTGLKVFRSGYDHGYWEAKDEKEMK